MLRGFACSTQHALLTKHFANESWRLYIAHIFASIYCPKSISQSTVLYFAWIAQSKQWYVGKTNVIRNTSNALQNSGPVKRYQEHLLGFVRENKHYGHFQRYKSWKRCAPMNFCFVPVLLGDERSILRYERCLITHLQVPTQ